ncbi:MAG: PAS domain S-box protein [Chloroflexota bacterium]|nr:PAS domain S-box protein [Chloroflexota bacterium]
MNSDTKSTTDPRVEHILDFVAQLAAGDLKARVTPSARGDDLDIVIAGLNMLAEALAQSEARYRTMIDQAHDAIIVTRDLKVLFANAGAKMLGYTPDELLNLAPIDIITPESLQVTLERYYRRLAGEDVISTYTADMIHRDGHIVPVEISAVVIEYDGDKANLVVARDVTERVRAQQALAQQAQELARSNAELEQFAYVASHDLREPLRKIKSYTELLERRYQGQLDAKADKYIAYIVDGAERMQTLVTDLLTYSRVGSGELVLVPTDLEAVLTQVQADIEAIIQESGAVITHDSLPTVTASPSQMTRLLQNM